MGREDILRTLKIGNRARDFDDSRVGAGRKPQPVDDVFKHILALLRQRTEALQLLGVHLRIHEALDLKPAKIFTEEDIQNLKKRSYVGCGGGEGKEHKKLKEYIAKNPEAIGIKNVVFTEMEHDLPSGDRLDVYFELKNGNRVAVEVKPSTAPDEDITRGIFQCVKYKAVMDALRTVEYGRYDNDTLLVVARPISEANKRLANDLGIEYREDF